MRLEGNAPKKIGNKRFVSPSRQCSSTPVGLGQGFDSTGASPIISRHGSSWFLPVPSNEISIEATALLWCYWHHLECDGRAEKTVTKWPEGMFATPLQSMAEVCTCTWGLYWRKCSLNNCILMYFSEINWFREHVEPFTYIQINL